jgi:hypothetical protein
MLSLLEVIYRTTGTFSFQLGEAFVYISVDFDFFCILPLHSYFFLHVPFYEFILKVAEYIHIDFCSKTSG